MTRENNLDAPALAIKTYYEENALNWLKEGRALFYQPIDHTGFGNKIRGLVGSFVFCLISRRFLFLADDLLNCIFDSPFKFSWNASTQKYAKSLARKAEKLSPPLRPDNWSDEFWSKVSHEKLENFPESNVVWYTESTSFYDALLTNLQYETFYKNFELDPENKLSTVGCFSSLLLSKVRTIWLNEKKSYEMQSSSSWSDRNTPRIGIQFRSFVDMATRRSDFEDFLEHLKTEALPMFLKKYEKVQFFVTTDNQNLTNELDFFLRNFGTTWISSFPVVLTGANSRSGKSLFDKLIAKLLQKINVENKEKPKIKRFYTTDNFLKKQLGNKVYPILDWLILGDCDVLVSTFTSYAVFAAARMGNRAKLYKIDPQNKFFGLPNGENYLF